MITLDGVERTLTAEELLICDARRAPQAIAGIMGGSTSEVSDATTEILLESAYFQPMGISKSSKRLGLRSESSARFERGIDPNGVPDGADRAMELLAEVAGATVLDGSLDVYPNPIERERIVVRTARVNELLGTVLDDAAVRRALEPLGMELEPVIGGFEVLVPTFRPDLEREIDLGEEVARRVGYNEIPRTVPRSNGQTAGLTPRQRDRRLVADTLVGVGCSEAFTLSLVAPGDLERLGVDRSAVVEAANPLRAEESLLRPCILPGLLRAVAHNDAHGIADLALFELGHVFLAPPPGQTLPDERDHLALALTGTLRRQPVEADRAVDVYDVVDCLRALSQALGIADLRVVAATAPGLHPVRSAAVVVDGERIGHLGELAPEALESLGATGPVVVAELSLDALLGAARVDRQFVEVSRFPASGIDLAFVLDDTVAAASVVETLRSAGGAVLEDVRCFDVFRSDALGAGRVSLAFALRYRALDRTLTDDDVGQLRQQAIDAVTSAHGAELRG
jgi:phenylalanyl-tRNA synthetase beta chain